MKSGLTDLPFQIPWRRTWSTDKDLSILWNVNSRRQSPQWILTWKVGTGWACRSPWRSRFWRTANCKRINTEITTCVNCGKRRISLHQIETNSVQLENIAFSCLMVLLFVNCTALVTRMLFCSLSSSPSPDWSGSSSTAYNWINMVWLSKMNDLNQKTFDAFLNSHIVTIKTNWKIFNNCQPVYFTFT